MSKLQAVFIDRDGTIGGTGHFIHPREFVLFPGAQEALLALKEKGIKVIALTNQHNIAKGRATEQDFIEQFAAYGFDASYICSHEPQEGCACHKPRPGLLHLAAQEHDLDLTSCAVIGDVGSTDMLAAAAVGARKVLVKTGWGQDSLDTYRHKWYDQAKPDYVADDLRDGVRWLIQDMD
ncbi:HAD-IIIA family hydrolase [Paenibacillus albus]|uniref:D,D-heptose 1,7-bisphosphate phosphatase n=1 Tax=Paenibacillus albus TaxID=2495582 RepID=A0A3S9A5Y2_9BACL|nr:HAD-IIIA family hydrolase [Paenibacillus albus]AZN41167.1 HAD-IIIA family hydrolase [Paenibacillus albus]